MGMDPKLAKYLVFLCAAVVVSDARPQPGLGPTLSVPKQRALHDTLARYFPDTTSGARTKLVRTTLSRSPSFEGGIAFLRRIEDASRRLGQGVDDETRQGVVADLARIAEVDGSVSFPELTVLRAIVANIGMPRPHRVDTDAGRVLLPGV